ncbi:MAG TPA: decaprenyl-phosphate phosphoribosyltransferase [Acidimicrobiales bacterium]|nr:decaprenyl-phosphate phosphoribosyltransferase [Acidimicrobiales bacterium]
MVEAPLADSVHASGQRPVPPSRPLAANLVRLARPRQWLKNLLVLAAPGAAGVLSHHHALLVALGATGIFCLASSGTYFVNDTVDAAADRLHPAKRHRPVASGAVAPGLALSIGTALVAGGLVSSWFLAGTRLLVVLGVYVGINVAYTVRLKHEPVVELACVASGFVLRAIAGGVAVNVPLSDWFLVVATFGSLFVVVGKRSAEHGALGDTRSHHRRTLGAYPMTFLRSARVIAASVTVTAYCLWAFERANHVNPTQHPIYFQLSILPVVVALLLVELRFETGHGAAPEDLALHDRSLQLTGLVWVALFAVGVYG